MYKHSRRIVTCCSLFFVIALAGWQAECQAQTGDREPLFRIADSHLSASPVVISYGDMRFTDPEETAATNPKIRRWLVDAIAKEKPDALLLGGDVVWHGQVANDYAVYESETAPWRTAHIFISATLGNHELNGDDREQCIQNWWNAFPKLRGKRWYSIQLGSKVFVLNLDSNSSLLPGSEQVNWLREQLASLPSSIKFVFLNLHHPPVADPLPNAKEDDSPRPNEIALAEFLKAWAPRKQARYIVTAAHVHNYERFLQDGVVYLVSGGGGAKPSALPPRGPADLYQERSDPNYHYMKFVVHEDKIEAQMIRVTDPLADSPRWEVKDRFQVSSRQGK